MAEDVDVSDETLNRWLNQEKPGRVSTANRDTVQAWKARRVPHNAPPQRAVREGASSYRPPIGWVQGRTLEVTALIEFALQRQRLVEAAIHELGEALELAADKSGVGEPATEEQLQALAGILEATRQTAGAPPQANAPQSRRQAKG